MSTIGEVRAAEKRVKQTMEQLGKASPKGDDKHFSARNLRRRLMSIRKLFLNSNFPRRS